MLTQSQRIEKLEKELEIALNSIANLQNRTLARHNREQRAVSVLTEIIRKMAEILARLDELELSRDTCA